MASHGLHTSQTTFPSPSQIVPRSFSRLKAPSTVWTRDSRKLPGPLVTMPGLMPFHSPAPTSPRDHPCVQSANFMNHEEASLTVRASIPICPSILVLRDSSVPALSITMCFVVGGDHAFLFRLNCRLCKGEDQSPWQYSTVCDLCGDILELLLELRQFLQWGSIFTDNIGTRIIFLKLVSSTLRSSMPKTVYLSPQNYFFFF